MDLIVPFPDPEATPPIPAACIHWTGLSIEPDARTIRVTYLVYRDRDARAAGKRHVDPLDYALSGADFDAYIAAHPEVAAMVEGLVREFAKARPELAGAVEAEATAPSPAVG
jgi:hypothetical protein